MRIQPLIQSALFDVADWEEDAEFSVFPQGARAKDAVFAPDVPSDPVIVAGKRYLFKRSRQIYPEQFWGEIVAYRIGCLLGVSVPPAFVAYNSKTGHCAALIEWFYSDGQELLVMAGDFLQKIQPDFDRKNGVQHNLVDNSLLMRTLVRSKTLETNWRQWWVDALLFDTLIGNTDRHQDNWGLIFFRSGDEPKCKLTPLFDNGTSLGHERLLKRVKNWQDVDFERYISKGHHHVKWACGEQMVIRGHFELLERAVAEWPEAREGALAKLSFSQDELSESLSDLCRFIMPVPLSADRFTFMLRLLTRRYSLLKSLLS